MKKRTLYINAVTGRATIVGANQVKLNNGKVVAAQQGGWYDGQQFWGGTLSNAGQINQQSNQQGAGTYVSKEVVTQTNPNNLAYLQKQNPQAAPNGGSPANGGTGFDMGAGSQPTLDVNALYNSSFNTPEITAANKAMSDKMAEIEARKKDLADREAQISDDPWLSEAQRIGKVNKLREKANQDIGNLTNEYTNLQNNLTSLKSDAQTKVDIGLKQYDINSQAYQQNLQKLNFLISSGALAGASGADLGSLSASTGISTGMLQAIVTKAGQTEPYLTSVSDPSGQYVVAIDKNSGQVINKQLIGSASGNGGGKATQGDYADLLKSKLQTNHWTLAQAFAGFQGYLDPDLIYQIYNSSNTYGPKGSSIPAKESLEYLNKTYGVSMPSKSAQQQNPFLQGQ